MLAQCKAVCLGNSSCDIFFYVTTYATCYTVAGACTDTIADELVTIYFRVAPTANPTAAVETWSPTVAPPTTSGPTSSPTNAAAGCARNCGQPSNGGGTCRLNGRCTSCNDNRVLQSGRCYVTIACKGRRIQSGSQAGSNCRCLDSSSSFAEHCHYCNRAAEGDTCRVCRDGYYLLDGGCVESCPAGMTAMGVGSFKRRCMEPFTCINGRIPDTDFGCEDLDTLLIVQTRSP